MANERLGRRGGGGGGSSGSGNEAKDTIELTDSNFDVEYFVKFNYPFLTSFLFSFHSQWLSVRKTCGLLNLVSI